MLTSVGAGFTVGRGAAALGVTATAAIRSTELDKRLLSGQTCCPGDTVCGLGLSGGLKALNQAL
jgi:hypothetical protein